MAMKLPWRRSNPGIKAAKGLTAQPESPLVEAGRLLRKRRESYGISLRELARETKITIPVLEAIERGWIDRLPEPTYLCSMLPLLEQRLELEPGSLSGALPQRVNPLKSRRSGGRLGRFTPGHIDVFTTWQGSVVYALVMFGTLIALNHQQRHLAFQQNQSRQPIAPRAESLKPLQEELGADAALRGLRPVADASRRSPRQWIDSLQGNKDPGNRHGLLVLNLSQPHLVKIKSGGGDRTLLSTAQGKISLQLQAPVQLTVQPPPMAADQVLWNGKSPKPAKPGLYRFGVAEP